MDATQAAAQAVAHIQGLYHDFANTRAHNAWLEEFQQAPCAWAVVHELLMTNALEVVQYFAAQTLVTKLQAGHVPEIDASVLQQELMRYLARYYQGPPAVRKQIVVALVDYALWKPPSEDGRWLSEVVQPLAQNLEAVPCLLELLACIPDEVINRKVVVAAERRLSFATNMLQHTGTVLDMLWKAFQSNAAYSVGCLRTFARWLHLQHASPLLRAQKKAAGSSGAYTADLIKTGGLHENPLLLQAAQALSNIGTAPLELLQAATDALCEAKALTNEAGLQARPLQLLVMRAAVAGGEVLLRMPEAAGNRFIPQHSEFASRAQALGKLVSELGGLFARLVVADGQALAASAQDPLAGAPPALVQETVPVSNSLSEVAQRFYTLRHVDLARCGVDFWYAALAQHLGAMAEEEDPFDVEATGVLSSGLQNNWAINMHDLRSQLRMKQQEEKPFLEPHIQNMVKASMRAARYPAEPDQEPDFEWDPFSGFREVCNINVTEACLVVSPQWIIEHVGTVLEGICARPVQEIQWQEIDSCIFTLTGVASRAPAGQDAVIPKLIELLPQLPYPTQGFKATLMRNAASRLVLFTSGYLALNTEPCKNTLRFLTLQHMPAIPELRPPDNDAKTYCQGMACDAMKQVMTHARNTIVKADNGAFWKDVVSAVTSLALDQRLIVDGRAHLIFGIGQILAVLPDWNELEQMLGFFTSRMQEPLNPLLAALPPEPDPRNARITTPDGKAPAVLKLYIASLSCVYNMPKDAANGMMKPDHHPVLRVVEQHFATIERACLHNTHYDEFMEQVCLAFSYILGYAREYAPSSPIFTPIMQLMATCCEQHPQPFYMGLVRSCVQFFATKETEQMNACLVDLTGLFIEPIARKLATNHQPQLPPPINAAAYEMLADMLRYWNLALLTIQKAHWFTDTLCHTVEILPRLAEENLAIHEKTLCAMLRFLRNVLLWGDPEMQKGADCHTGLRDLVREAQNLVNERNLPRGGTAWPRIVGALARLLAAAAPNNPGQSLLVPVVAEVLIALFSGPFDYFASAQFPVALKNLPAPLGASFSETDLQRLVQQLKMDRQDKRRFIRTVIGLAEQFGVTLKRAKFTGG